MVTAHNKNQNSHKNKIKLDILYFNKFACDTIFQYYISPEIHFNININMFYSAYNRHKLNIYKMSICCFPWLGNYITSPPSQSCYSFGGGSIHIFLISTLNFFIFIVFKFSGKRLYIFKLMYNMFLFISSLLG